MRLLLCLLALPPAFATAATYSIGPEQSQVRFTATFLGHEVSGAFEQFSGTVSADPAHPEKFAAEARIAVASISTGIDRRNRHLRSPDYFDADKHPEIVFHSRSVKPAANGDFELRGDLTIKQTTQGVVLHVHPLSASAWEARAEVNRKDFGIARAAFADRGIGDTIGISLHIQGRR